MHRWHHADQHEAYDKNFSTKLALWDWVFSTAYLPDRGTRKADRYGLSTRVYPETFPTAYFIHHAYAFLPTPARPEQPSEP
jgi:sterol desaturase/sphingolipid hydroxylase (fatty acid hydroxylase superfamily)